MTTRKTLPAERTSLVGRVHELAALEAMLAQHRLVTLTGVGGVGKSRLALRAAERAALADGARFVPLAPLREPALLWHVVLEELGLADPSPRKPESVVAEWLAGKELLLVLDSCEHLAERCARMAVQLLEAAPGLRILATSRQPLDVVDERMFAVAPLPVPEPPRSPGEPVACVPGDAVELFAERAAARVPGFTLTEEERVEAAAVCRRLDGIPLAVELAAAHLADLPRQSVGHLNERLRHRFEDLAEPPGAGGGAALPRHRTLRTTIGWSHELCTPLERLLWARLSVFTGGFDLAGARAVGGGGPLVEGHVGAVLDGLVAKSLVLRLPDDRFGMLDTVAEYGVRWLAELGEEVGTRRRHRDFYAAMARRADAEWIGPDQVDWYRRLVAEHANFRTALDFCLTSKEFDAVMGMSGALWMMWYAFGFAREGALYLDAALERETAPGPARTKALWARAMACVALGDLVRCGRLAAELRGCPERAADPTARAAFAYVESAPLTLGGDQDRAAEVLDAPLATCGPATPGAYPVGWFMMRMCRAYVHVASGEFAACEAVAAEVTAECEVRQDRWARGYVAFVRAHAAVGAGRLAEAAAHAREAVADKALLRDSLGLASAVDALAIAVTFAGESARGARLLGIAHQLWQTLGAPQMGGADLMAARAETERLSRESLGDTAYDTEFTHGLTTPPPEAITYCLTTP
ncbi:ATP-binding protein [Streptomyces sp. WG-D5]